MKKSELYKLVKQSLKEVIQEPKPVSNPTKSKITEGPIRPQSPNEQAKWLKLPEIQEKLKKAKLKILGSMSSALDYTTKHGMVNYELK